MELQWKYLINQFVVTTTKNFKKALKLSTYHDAALLTAKNASPPGSEYEFLYNRYHPFHLEFVGEYYDWKNAGGSQEGQTLNLDQQLELLVSKAGRWDAQVQVQFDKKSPQYKSIFPNGRAPFNSGTPVTRVVALQTLSAAVSPFPTLGATKLEVDAFYTILNNALNTQEGAKGTTKARSEQVENKRLIVMTEQYRNLGYMIDKGADDTDGIAPFFELSILRNQRQTLFTGTLDPGENEAVLIHTFLADDELNFELTGAAAPPGTQAQFYLATTPNGTDSNPISVTANSGKLTIEANQFGAIDLGTHRYLTAVNTSAAEMHYEIELL